MSRFRLFLCCTSAALLMLAAAPSSLQGQDKSKDPDVLVLSNGDTLHGKVVQEAGGTVTFHSESLGDITLSWDKIQSLHTAEVFAVMTPEMKKRTKRAALNLPTGTVEESKGLVTLHPENGATIAPIPVKDAQVIVESAVLDKQLNHEPGFLQGWNGAATAGATLVTATQNSYAISGSLGMVRTIPTVPWLDPRNRTSFDFAGSYGKITQPSYTSGGVFTPSTSTKSSILHLDAERDEYFSPRMFGLGQAVFDHNFGQDLNLQQIYGGGLGWTVLKTPKQEADLKATMQYERQSFITGTPANQDLIGSTFSADYSLKLKLVSYTQGLAFIPAYNNTRAYSATETNTFAFPAYKNFAFSVGTLDSYLNDPPTTEPPTKRNSFQFTMGVTYAIKSKY
jgi:Protein of unknown function, DUF481